MTIAQIKALFQTGKIPTEADFSNLIDMIPNNDEGGDIDLSNPSKPTFKFLENIRIVKIGSKDIYLVLECGDKSTAYALHFHSSGDRLEYGYGQLSNPINDDNGNIENDIVDFTYTSLVKSDTNSNTIVAKGSYNGNSGHYVFTLTTINRTEVPLTINFINSNVSNMWYRSNSVLSADRTRWGTIKSKINSSQDISSDMESFLTYYKQV